jgi:hypothetical protein
VASFGDRSLGACEPHAQCRSPQSLRSRRQPRPTAVLGATAERQRCIMPPRAAIAQHADARAASQSQLARAHVAAVLGRIAFGRGADVSRQQESCRGCRNHNSQPRHGAVLTSALQAVGLRVRNGVGRAHILDLARPKLPPVGVADCGSIRPLPYAFGLRETQSSIQRPASGAGEHGQR